MEFTTWERILLLDLLPENVHPSLYKVFHELMMELSFTDKEMENLQMWVDEEGTAYWKQEAERNIEVNIGNALKSFIHSKLKEYFDKELLNDEHLSLYNKFKEEG